MKTFDDYNNMDEKEKIFLELSHLDELEIKFSLIEHENSLYYFYKDNCLFDQEKKYKDFNIHYYKIWLVFKKKFGLKYNQTKYFMSEMLDKYFGLKYYLPQSSSSTYFIQLDIDFKNNI